MRRLPVFIFASIALTAHAQFALQDSTTTADLRGIAAIGDGTAWASGTHGTILRTEDGGFVWQGCATPPGAQDLDFRAVQAFDAQTALAMSSGKGSLSRIYKTIDGCQTWKLVFTNPDTEGFFDALRAMTRDRLFVLGDPVHGGFVLFQSSDAGASWQRSDSMGLSADAATQGAFAASNSSLVAAGLSSTFFGTGGKANAFFYERTSTTAISGPGASQARVHDKFTWTRVPVPMASGRDSTGIFSLASDLESGNIVAVGGDYLLPNAAEGTAAFRTSATTPWKASFTSPHGYRSSVAYDATSKTWIAVGPNGTDISRDNGRNWAPLRPAKADAPDADRGWNALSLPYVVGPHGRIGRLREDALPKR